MVILFSNRSPLIHSIKRWAFIKSHFKRNVETRNFSSRVPGTKERILPFQEILSRRRDEANRSILVQVQSALSAKELYSYCNSLGKVKNMLHYTSSTEPMHFIVVEFESIDDANGVLNSASYLDDANVMAVHSPFLWFRAPNKRVPMLKPAKNFELLVENGNSVQSEFEITDALSKAGDVSEQMVKLHKMTQLNDLGTRLRFLVARQVECALSGTFPSATALPFGSSVNGCGKMGCDLDLVLKLSDSSKVSDRARLVFHSKASMASERTACQRSMELFGDMIQLFLPGCSQVRRILQARVPIIKFHHQFADVECDLSMSNLSGVYMSDFLYLMGALDPRVRPLVFTIRRWASAVGLTNSFPGRWITNFSLTLMVYSFLQSGLGTQPILPSLNQLVKMAGPNDKFITDEGVNCTFLKDPNKYLTVRPTSNTDNLETLLQKFFDYYSHFDFEMRAICLNEAVSLTKPEHSALYIVNPLERGLNVSKNVSLEELYKFQAEIRSATWILEAEQNKTNHWGLLSLFKKPLGGGQKRFEVSKLFEKDVDFKSKTVEQEVRNIRKATKEQLRKIEADLDVSSQKSGR